MGVPTGGDIAIYRSNVRTFEVKAQVEIDQIVFPGSWSDEFNGTSVDTTKWLQYIPEGWGSITVSSGYVEVDGGQIDPDPTCEPVPEIPDLCESQGVPYPPYMVSRSTSTAVFPTQQNDFTLEARISFPEITAYGVQFRAQGPQTSVFEVEANTDGYLLNVKLGNRFDLGTPVWTGGIDTSWHTYKLAYTAATTSYQAYVDGSPVGSPWVSDELPINLVIGNSAVNQGFPGWWTKIRVDYIRITGTAETSSIPGWATPFTEDSITWSYLPTLLDGDMTISKENNVDTARVTALNSDNSSQGIYAGTNFHGRRIRIKSRVGDGVNWTSWRTRYRGVVDEAQFNIDGGLSTLTLSCKDEPRRKMFRTLVVKSYGDYDQTIKGVKNNLTMAQIVTDLLENEALIDSSDYSLTSSGSTTTKPKTFNVVDRSVGDAVKDLLESVVYAWYINPSDGVLKMDNWFWDDSGLGIEYTIATDTEIDVVNWARDAFNAIGQSVVGLQSVSGFDISVAFPGAPLPAGSPISRFFARTGESFDDLENNEIPYKRWRRENRRVGAINVTMTCQNWVEHNQRLGVDDPTFLGVSSSKTWIVDAWRESFSGSDYTIEVTLIDPEFDQVIIDGIVG